MAKGKCYSLVDRGQRRKGDEYPTPHCLTNEFLKLGFFDPALTTLEPACGEGAIVKVLKDHGFADIIAYDREQDFLKETRKIPQIITNPPYSLAFEFIQKAKEICTHRFAFLLPLSYLHGQRRYEQIWLDEKFTLRSIYVFTRYPHLGLPLREDGLIQTGMQAYAWYLWEKGFICPTIDWIDINKYIYRKGVKHDTQ